MLEASGVAGAPFALTKRLVQPLRYRMGKHREKSM